MNHAQQRFSARRLFFWKSIPPLISTFSLNSERTNIFCHSCMIYLPFADHLFLHKKHIYIKIKSSLTSSAFKANLKFTVGSETKERTMPSRASLRERCSFGNLYHLQSPLFLEIQSEQTSSVTLVWYTRPSRIISS